jgi:hypothetical protein
MVLIKKADKNTEAHSHAPKREIALMRAWFHLYCFLVTEKFIQSKIL